MNKKYRVRKNEEFQKIIQKRISYANKEFVLYSCKNDLGYLRCGLSVSKKLGKATVRNKIKRQVRHMIRNSFDKNESYDYIVIVRANYLSNSFSENEKSLKNLKQKVQNRRQKNEPKTKENH